jgi:DUF1365 family protein
VSLSSAIYQGNVYHKRFTPTVHEFRYDIYLFWLKLKELPELAQIDGFNVDKKGWLEFRRSDYLNHQGLPLEEEILAKMNDLRETLNKEGTTPIKSPPIIGDVYFLGQTRMLNLYFSPVNFYYVQDPITTQFTFMLAEVSNTPWHERHYYLVDLNEQADTQKEFHVSPFNPMDMQYKWHISQPGEDLKLTLSCYKQIKHMVASIDLQRQALTATNLSTAKKRIPSMTLKTVGGIYWQALKLFIKRTPFYGYAKPITKSGTEPVTKSVANPSTKTNSKPTTSQSEE